MSTHVSLRRHGGTLTGRMVASDDLLDLESLSVVGETLLQLGVLATRTGRGLGWSQYWYRQSPSILWPRQ